MARTTRAVGFLDRAAARITAQNSGQSPIEPPPYAMQSPLEEVLVAEMAEGLPAELTRSLATAPSIDHLYDLLGAAQLFKWMDGESASRFAVLAGHDPRAAGMAWARALALAGKLPPPARSKRWYALDRLGAALQAAAVIAVLMTRGLVLLAAGCWAAGHSYMRVDLPDAVMNVTGLAVFTAPLWNGLRALLPLAAAALWLCAEMVLMQAVEGLRLLPLRRDRPPVTRVEILHLLWMAHVVFLLAALHVRAIAYAAGVWSALSPQQRICVLAGVTISVVVCALSAIRGWRTLTRRDGRGNASGMKDA